ncbi:MAG: rhombosortase [Steroidobacteraceae bacterium]
MRPAAPRTRVTRWLASVNADGRRGIALALLVALFALMELGGDVARAGLRYERAPIATGEWWRLITAHGVHLGPRHAALNALGALLMWVLFAGDYTGRQWAAIVAGSVLAIDAGLWWLSPGASWYVGSSGVLHGVLGAGTLAHLRRGERDGWLLASFIVAKVLWEQTQGALPLSGSAASVIVDAHCYGALGGCAAAFMLRLRDKPL